MLKDHLGPTSIPTDSSGNVVGDQRYYPFGETRILTGSMYTDRLFTGQREMTASGIYYYGARFYSPKLGRFLSDSSGNVVGDQRFYPFGETRLVTGTMYTDRLFTGQREMTGSGIYYYGARYYSPKLGRFLSADTIVPGYGNPQNLNRYSYVLNNPVKLTDPTGHKCVGNEEECEDDDGNPINGSSGNTGGDDDEDKDTNPGSDKPLLDYQYGDITCGDEYIGCERIGDVLLIRYKGEQITINLLLATSADVVVINDFIRYADQRSSSLQDMQTDIPIAVGGLIVAGGGVFTGQPIIGGIAIGVAVIAGVAAYNDVKDYKAAMAVLPDLWVELKPLNILD